MTPKETFDFIVVGAGASGCVIANRLSADPGLKVLLLEAGPMDTDPRLHSETGFVELWGSDLDWKITSETQAGMDGRQIVINQGKVLGGSTAINAMMYVRCNRRNYDLWNALGADGWSFEDILPYYIKIEDYAGGASEYHGVGGPLKVAECPDPDMRSEAFQMGATELGYDGPYWDINGARQENGAGMLQFHIDPSGNRSSAATAYLAPIMKRANLTVRTEAEVTRVLFDGTRATGVAYNAKGQTHEVHAAREVILSAGAFFSPKLLLLSGIGPAAHLREVGIDVRVDLPGVGQNLQDHVQLPIVFQSNIERPHPTLLTGNVLFVKTRAGMKEAPPDLQLNFTPAVPKPLLGVMQLPVPACVFLPIMVQPFSIGEVRLRSANPADLPLVNPNYLTQDADVQVFVEAVKLARRMVKTKAFSDYGAELAPGADTPLEPYIRSQSSTLWHPAGTARIGRDRGAVVDPQLRVHGIEGLRVADASVMPTVTSGNTVAPCFMIGEKAADMILKG